MAPIDPAQNCKCLIVLPPYPQKLRQEEKSLQNEEEPHLTRDFVRWISCLMKDKNTVLGIMFKPKYQGILIEVPKDKPLERLLGRHYWKDEIKNLKPGERDMSSCIYVCSEYKHSDLAKGGWKDISGSIDPSWLEDFDLEDNNLFKPCPPKPEWCDSEVSNKQYVVNGEPRWWCKRLDLAYFPEKKKEVDAKQQEDHKAEAMARPGTMEYFALKEAGTVATNTPEIKKKKNRKANAPIAMKGVGAASKPVQPTGPRTAIFNDLPSAQQVYESVLGKGPAKTSTQDLNSDDQALSASSLSLVGNVSAPTQSTIASGISEEVNSREKSQPDVDAELGPSWSNLVVDDDEYDLWDVPDKTSMSAARPYIMDTNEVVSPVPLASQSPNHQPKPTGKSSPRRGRGGSNREASRELMNPPRQQVTTAASALDISSQRDHSKDSAGSNADEGGWTQVPTSRKPTRGGRSGYQGGEPGNHSSRGGNRRAGRVRA